MDRFVDGGAVKRRTLLKTALGTGALSLGTSSSHAMSQGSKRRLITVYSRGGWDTTMVFDPVGARSKVQSASDGQVQSSGGVSFVASAQRPSVSEFFERFGAQSVIINGVSINSISHDKCARLLFTGDRRSNKPDYASILATGSEGLPLPYVILSGPRFTGSLGYNVTRVDQGFVDSLTQPSQIDFSLVESAVQQSIGVTDSERVDEYLRTLERRQQLRPFASLFPSTISLNPVSQIDLLTTLLSNDLSAVGLIQVLPPPFRQWDSHSGNDESQSGCFEYLFEQLVYLADSLERTVDNDGVPLSESTTVMVLSEMGRTPVYNTAEGKDHWPYTSMLIFGAGVEGGQVVGATDDQLISAPVDLSTGQLSNNGKALQVEQVLSGLLASFDVDPKAHFASDVFTAPFAIR